VLPGAGGQLEDPVLRERADGQVVVAGPAEATEVRAATHHFDQEPRAELGFRGKDRGGRRIHRFRRPQCGLAHHGRRTGPRLRDKRPDRSVARVLHVVERGHVEPAFSHQAAQQIGAVARAVERVHERRNQRLTLSGGDDVGKQGQRLRVHERHGAANHHERIPMRPLGGTNRNAGQPQQREDVRVVPLKGDGQREDIEVADERLRLQRHEIGPGRALRFELALRRQEHPLADDVLFGVEEGVHRLESEVGHPDEIGIGERERDAKPATVRLAYIAHFLREELAGSIALRPGLRHGTSGG
jgi:hypothetical protein